MTVLTVEQHKQAVKLGIAQRSDGLWGFKKKCANEKCNTILEDTCYATETFEEAVREVARRSSYSCDNKCWAESGNFWPYLDGYDNSTLAEIGDCDDSTVTRLLRRLKNGSTWNLPVKDWKVIEKWIHDVADNYDGDLDENEVGCEF